MWGRGFGGSTWERGGSSKTSPVSPCTGDTLAGLADILRSLGWGLSSLLNSQGSVVIPQGLSQHTGSAGYYGWDQSSNASLKSRGWYGPNRLSLGLDTGSELESHWLAWIAPRRRV